MPEFFTTPAGHAVFAAVLAVLAIVIIELNYKIFFKCVLDFIFALVAVIVLSPLLVATSIISYKRAGVIYERTPCLGIKGKIIFVRAYAGINGKLKNLPRLFDILAGRMSFTGVKLLPLTDGAFMDDRAMERCNARPGLINHLSLWGGEELTYEEIFELDKRYARRRELFTDIFIVIKCAVLAIRGDGRSYMGESRNATYAEALSARGEITREDISSAEKSADEAIEDLRKRSEFKKQKYK